MTQTPGKSSDTAPPALLTVQDLHVSFRHPHQPVLDAVRGISFTVGAGETVGLVGESGSGKSVTALSILGLLPESGVDKQGAIHFEGADLLQQSEAALQKVRGNRIAMIFQEPMTSLNPVYTCGDQVAEVVRLHQQASRAQARRGAEDMFARVQLADPARVARSYPHQLSGGMRQRVMIAMALACSPRLLIADEPTTALDVTIQAEILQLLRDLQQEDNLSILLISHDLGVVGEMADRLEIMQEGLLVEGGASRRVFQDPRHDYTRRLLDALPGAGPVRAASEDKVPTDSSAGASTEPLLQVEDLEARFVDRRSFWGRVQSEVAAVDGVSLILRAGETLGVVGESGSGKSTLARAILRLVPPRAGVVRFAGQDVGKLQGEDLRQVRRRMQIVFQDPFSSLNPRIRVGDAIAEVLQVHGLVPPGGAAARVAELLAQVGLDAARAGQFPHEFSGGQRQRLVIARALAAGPELLLCDEPVSSLDVSIQAQILDLLERLQDTLGLSYLFISHDIRVVHQVADRVAVMHRGRFVEQGDVQRVLEQPEHPYTRRLLDSSPRDPRLAAS